MTTLPCWAARLGSTACGTASTAFFVVDWGWEVTGSVRCFTGSTGFHGSLSVHRRAGHTDRFRPRTTQRSPWVRVWTRKATSRPDTVEIRVPLFESLGPVCARELSQLRTNRWRSEEHTSELQSRGHLVCRLLLEKKKTVQIHL